MLVQDLAQNELVWSIDGSQNVFQRVSACDWEEKDSSNGRTLFRFSFAGFDESKYGLLLFDQSRGYYVAINKNELYFGVSSPKNMGLLYKGKWLDGIQLEKSFFENARQCPFANQSN
jgi:hypothetical protein